MPSIFLRNTATRSRQEFPPRSDFSAQNPVKIYSCGPTVYGAPHIGNLRSFFTAGLLGDLLRAQGYPVQHTINITDVGHLTGDGDEGEDKLSVGARREGKTAREIAEFYTQVFFEAIKKLHLHFDFFPRATAHIDDQKNLVQSLIDRGFTYEIPDDGIYFDTSKFPGYGELLPPEHLAGIQSGARIANSAKKNPTDFALRKFSPAGSQREMEREFQGKMGFPGRHLECSAMSRATLGDRIDIHTGGIDHVPVHHTNEIAQSQCGFCDSHGAPIFADDSQPRVKFRVHCQFLNIDSQKISKSLGNIVTLAELEEQGFAPEDLRMFFFQAHYRSFQDFTLENLRAAQSRRKNLHKKIRTRLENPQISQILASHNFSSPKFATQNSEQILAEISDPDLKKSFTKILQNFSDDLSTVAAISEFQSEFLAHFDQHFAQISENPQNFQPKILSFFTALARLDARLLKLDLFAPTTPTEIPAEIRQLAEQRQAARAARDFARADQLRDEIDARGREILDTPDGFDITKK